MKRFRDARRSGVSNVSESAKVELSRPLKNSSWLRAVKIRQLCVAESRRLCGDVCDSAPWSDELCRALADEAVFQRAARGLSRM